jgi:hypothetical protein
LSGFKQQIIYSKFYNSGWAMLNYSARWQVDSHCRDTLVHMGLTWTGG